MRNYYITRNFSSSCTSFMAKKLPKFFYPTKEQRKAQKNFDSRKHSEIIQAQKFRSQWEFPVQADQRATWKHRRWFDVFFNKWVSTLPQIPPRSSVNYKNRREYIFQAETPYELFQLLLDSYQRKKTVIQSFDHESPISNISYYYQYLTNTKYIHGLPISISEALVDEIYLEKFRSFVKEVILIEYNNEDLSAEEDPFKKSSKIAAATMKAVMQYLVATLTPTNSNLSQCEVDYNVENAMFWLRGTGFLKWTLPNNHPVALQCHDPVFMQVRSKEEIPAFSSQDGNFSTTGVIPSFPFTPHVFKQPLVQYRNSILSGYKLFGGDCNQNYQYANDEDLLHELPPPTYNECRNGHTQLLLLPETYTREWYKENLEHGDITGEIEEHLKGRGIMSGWVWNAALAHYQQYWMDKDVDKPFCSQSIVSDGQYLSFFCYQLNTIAIDSQNIVDNERRNLCFGRTSVKLFDEVNENEVIGLNDEALLLLIKFIGNGARQHKSVVTTDEQLEEYNANLPLQDVDPERPEIEVQKPVQKIEMDRIRLEEEKAREEENRRNKPLKAKIKDTVFSLLPK